MRGSLGWDAQFVKVEVIEPLVRAGFVSMESLASARPMRDAPSMRNAHCTTQQVNLVAEMTGSARGIVVYGMSLTAAQKVAAAKLQRPVDVMDDEAWEAVSELGRTIRAKANELLSEAAPGCSLGETAVIRGVGAPLPAASPAIVAPLVTGLGRMEIVVGLAAAQNPEAP